MSKTIRLTKGLDIPLEGEANKLVGQSESPKTYAVQPPDFPGIWPKVLVEAGQEVKAGTPLFYHKDNEQLVFTSPVSGEVAEVKRGEKRKLLEITILADKEINYVDFGESQPADTDRDDIIEKLLKSGLWPLLKERPFANIASPDVDPKSIMVLGFDNAPLAPDTDFIIKEEKEAFDTGLEALKKLTSGKVHVNIHGKLTDKDSILRQAKGVEINTFYGPHPSSTAGIQIHHLDPVHKSSKVWYTRAQDVVAIGKLFMEGRLRLETLVAITGAEVKERNYHKVIRGANIEPFVKGNVTDNKNRYISGNVLTGRKIEADGHIGYYDNQITVVQEGDQHEFMGWLMPSYPRPSISRTFPWTYKMDSMKFRVNTNVNGEHRNFVVTGEYEKVLPMDIYPVFLLKSILVKDFDKMEAFGIYEVAEEDMALCEFVCTSKQPVQKILRQGLDELEAEG